MDYNGRAGVVKGSGVGDASMSYAAMILWGKTSCFFFFYHAMFILFHALISAFICRKI